MRFCRTSRKGISFDRATTENPSFEVNSALLSRMRVYVLTRLAPEDISKLIERALADSDRGLGKMHVTLAEGALDFIAAAADGDARRGLMLLELTAEYVGAGKTITTKDLRRSIRSRFSSTTKQVKSIST